MSELDQVLTYWWVPTKPKRSRSAHWGKTHTHTCPNGWYPVSQPTQRDRHKNCTQAKELVQPPPVANGLLLIENCSPKRQKGHPTPTKRATTTTTHPPSPNIYIYIYISALHIYIYIYIYMHSIYIYMQTTPMAFEARFSRRPHPHPPRHEGGAGETAHRQQQAPRHAVHHEEAQKPRRRERIQEKSAPEIPKGGGEWNERICDTEKASQRLFCERGIPAGRPGLFSLGDLGGGDSSGIFTLYT